METFLELGLPGILAMVILVTVQVVFHLVKKKSDNGRKTDRQLLEELYDIHDEGRKGSALDLQGQHFDLTKEVQEELHISIEARKRIEGQMSELLPMLKELLPRLNDLISFCRVQHGNNNHREG